MRSVLRGLAIAVATLLSLAFAMNASAESGCYQYGSWDAAQAAHEANPGLGLDADGNGTACDCLLQGFPC